MLYLDNAATTPVRREVLEAMWPYLTAEFGNPSSVHTVGERAATALADARSRVARVLGVRASDIVFTSGGTEADNLSIKGIALGDPRGRHIVTTAIEHEAVLQSVDYLRRLHGFEVSFVPLTPDGTVTTEALAAVLRENTTLVSVMYANNEIGTIQDIASLSALSRERRIPFHTDAVQAAGWLDLSIPALGVDALSLSGHKIGAPKGIGVAYLRGRLPIEPLLSGGGQERARRSGTENVAFAVGLATALDLAESERADATGRVGALRTDFLTRVCELLPRAIVTGHPSRRLPAHASFCFPGTSGEGVLLELERRGVISSSGSACAAGSAEPSHVLTALGVPADVAATAVRFTFSAGITAEELEQVANAVAASVRSLTDIRR
ncbi:cysteine desulfurase family protein [Mycetocola zhadangensis]|uniref:cysteine desulfurase n=1 Tax=Mycetocola zhadangensis TaxID=1164595 RepID=A0A3L7JB20_9MICO|nr:cysteine desulfurase family protein [Mycetocola zhadangensis]RLQ85702.1 cysteine desulfurase [Mycetocola zhadangensis]GGE84942.1 cysteine desulfurase [Mycetocola zhadangensis]